MDTPVLIRHWMSSVAANVLPPSVDPCTVQQEGSKAHCGSECQCDRHDRRAQAQIRHSFIRSAASGSSLWTQTRRFVVRPFLRQQNSFVDAVRRVSFTLEVLQQRLLTPVVDHHVGKDANKDQRQECKEERRVRMGVNHRKPLSLSLGWLALAVRKSLLSIFPPPACTEPLTANIFPFSSNFVTSFSNRIVCRATPNSVSPAEPTPDDPAEISVPVLPQHLARVSSSVRRYAAVVAFSLVVRLLALFVLRNAPFTADANDYVDVARRILEGASFVPYWPPGLPLYLAPWVAAGASPVVLRAAMLPFWMLACWALWRLLRAFGVERVGWLVLLVFSCLPDSIQLSIEPLTQMPVAALLLVAVGSLVRLLRSDSVREYLLMGAALGLTALIRPSAAVLLLLLPVGCVLVRRRVAAAAASALLGFALLAGWLVRSHQMTGHFVFNTANSYNFYYGNNPWTPPYQTWYFGSHAKPGSMEILDFPDFADTMKQVYDLPEIERPALLQHLAFDEIRSHFARFLFRSFNRLRCFFGFSTFTAETFQNVRFGPVPLMAPVLGLEMLTFLALLLPAAFWLAQASSSFWTDPRHSLPALALLAYALPYWLSMSHPTYNFPVLLPIAVLGVVAWSRSARRTIRPGAWVAVSVVLLIQVEWLVQMITRVNAP